MREDGDVDGVERVAIIAAEPAGGVAQLANCRSGRARHIARRQRPVTDPPAGAGGIEAAAVLRIMVAAIAGVKARVIARLVARRKQNERRMIAVGREDARGFRRSAHCCITGLPKIRPQAAFGLEIKTHFVGASNAASGGHHEWKRIHSARNPCRSG